MVAIVAVALEEAILEVAAVAAVAVDHLESLELVINLFIYKLFCKYSKTYSTFQNRTRSPYTQTTSSY